VEGPENMDHSTPGTTNYYLFDLLKKMAHRLPRLPRLNTYYKNKKISVNLCNLWAKTTRRKK
jgi:hypothetical protein